MVHERIDFRLRRQRGYIENLRWSATVQYELDVALIMNRDIRSSENGTRDGLPHESVRVTEL